MVGRNRILGDLGLDASAARGLDRWPMGHFHSLVEWPVGHGDRGPPGCGVGAVSPRRDAAFLAAWHQCMPTVLAAAKFASPGGLLAAPPQLAAKIAAAQGRLQAAGVPAASLAPPAGPNFEPL